MVDLIIDVGILNISNQRDDLRELSASSRLGFPLEFLLDHSLGDDWILPGHGYEPFKLGNVQEENPFLGGQRGVMAESVAGLNTPSER